MSYPGKAAGPEATLVAAVAALVVAVAIAGNWAAATPPASAQGGLASVVDWTGYLGTSYLPGAPQAFGSNASTVLVGGIGSWDKPAGHSVPMLVALHPPFGTQNLTPVVEPFFHDGGVFGNAWNGSGWLFTGEGTWGGEAGGVLLSYARGVWTNLSPLVRPFTSGQGLWAGAWNGTGWLLGGNSSAGSTLLSFDGRTVRDLTSELPHNRAGDWIQLIAWNGSAWVVGGKGTFGVLSGGRYTDLLPRSPFAGSGVYAAGWNGTAWLIGGGPPAVVDRLQGTVLSPAASLPDGFSGWVNSILWGGSGWLAAGKGFPHGPDSSAAELAYWPTSAAGFIDLSARLPTAFDGGQVQFADWVPSLGPHTALLVGQGHLDETTGYSTGAAALVIFA